MIYLKKQIIDSIVSKFSCYKIEFVVPIYHYKVTSGHYLFRNYKLTRINEFPIQFIIINNKYNLSAKNLYEYIWNLNKLYINHPNLDTKKFLAEFNLFFELDFFGGPQAKILIYKNRASSGKIEQKINKNENNIFDGKLCYPFVLRYIKIPKEEKDNNPAFIRCSFCPWYSFCSGCIIDPRGDLKKLSSEFGIAVDWCNNFIEEEFSSKNFELIKDLDNKKINENLNIDNKNRNNKNINDCFYLFSKEENSKDNVQYCIYCNIK